VPGATGAGSVTFVDTRQLGVYRAELIPDPAAEPDPAVSPLPSPSISPVPSPATVTPAPSPGGLPEPGTADEPLLFAVDLFSPDESNIRPGDGARITALGSSEELPASEAGVARDEFWPLLAALVLGFLLAEWMVYERDGARRIANRLRGALPARTGRRNS
jgi:hypothetical protein